MNKEKLFRITTEYQGTKYSVLIYEDVINFSIGSKNYSCFLNNLEELTFTPARNNPIAGLITIKGVGDGGLLMSSHNGVHEINFEKPDEDAAKELYEYMEPFTKLQNDYDYTLKKTFNKNKTGIRRIGLPLIKDKIDGKIKFNNNFIILELSDGELIISRNLLSYKGEHIDLNRVISDDRDANNMIYTINEPDKSLTVNFKESDSELIDQLENYMEYFILNNA